jgi:hypothetical protein
LAPQAAHSQVPPVVVGAGIGLGYGPLSIVPVSAGIPVFTQGDSIWVQSYSNSTDTTLILNSPFGGVEGPVYLAADSLTKLYTILPGDPSGVWTLDVFPASKVSSQVEIMVSNFTALPPPNFEGAGLEGDNLTVAYSMANTPAYSVQACLMGSLESPSVDLPLPPSIGGELQVSVNGTGITSLAPSATKSFESWSELYEEMTYANGTNLVSDQVLAADTPATLLGTSTVPVTTGMTTYLNLRTGRYDLRSYVRGATGLLTFDTPYLRVNGTAWVSLAGCSDLASVDSDSFQLTANLNGSTTGWPRQLITMYEDQGVDSFTMSKVPVEEVRIDLGNATQAAGLSAVAADVTGAGVTGGGVESFASHDAEVYVVGREFPLDLTVTLSFENVTSQSYFADFELPFSTASLPVPIGAINITASSGGSPLANATVYVSAVGDRSTPISTNGTGFASIVLPPGSYNLTLSDRGNKATEIVQVASGQTTAVSLDVSPSGFTLLEVALLGLLAVGVGVNALIWRDYARRRNAFR